MTYPQEARDGFYSQEQSDAAGWLLLVEHPQLGVFLRFTTIQGPRDTDGIYKLPIGDDVWLYAPFAIQPPGEGPDFTPGRLRVPDLDFLISRALDPLETPLKMTIIPVLKSDPTIQIWEPVAGLEWRNISGNPPMIEGDLAWPDRSISPWPVDRMRLSKYRAMKMALG